MPERLPRFKRDIRKRRGCGSGYGGKKKHRGKGSRGGKGWAGSSKHRRSYIYSYKPDHFGYRGFRPPSAVITEDVVINLESVEEIANKTGRTELDLNALGYTKLLGRGAISKPLTIKIARASESAQAAVEKAGGKLILSEKAAEPKAGPKAEPEAKKPA